MNIPVFNDMAAEYGLDDDSHTTQAAFFDYDNDGDLDVYLTVNEINDRNSPYIFHHLTRDGSNSSRGSCTATNGTLSYITLFSPMSPKKQA